MGTDKTHGKIGFAWLRDYGHVLLLAVAALILACCYFPTYCLAGLNSDMIIPAIFYRDITHGGHATDWYWGGASFLFPDLAANFFWHALLGDGVRALEVVSALFFLGWVLSLVLGYWHCDLPHVDVFAALTLLLAVALAEFSLPCFFHSVEHGGGYLMTLLTLAYLQQAWRQGWRGTGKPVLVAVLILLTCGSDSLVLIVLVAPVVATLLAGSYRFPDRFARGWQLALIVGLPGLLGASLIGAIFPPQLATAGYTSFDWSNALNSLRSVRHSLDFKADVGVTLLSAADLGVVAGTAWYLARQLRSPVVSTESPTRFFILAYTFFLISFNWAAAIVSGNYLGADSTRYLVLALVWPLILLVGWLSTALPWPRWQARLLAVAVSAFGLVVAFHPPTPDFYLDETQVLEPGLAAVMKQENTPVALGNYWCANITTVLSEGATTVLALSKHEQASHWFVNRLWYANEPAGGFRLVLVQKEKPDFVRAHFGEPQRIVRLGDTDVWVYAPENAIHFIPNFDTIGNRQSFPDGNTFRLQAAGLYHTIGMFEGDELVARSGRDLNGLIADGPDVLFKPGRYRTEFSYRFLAAPDEKREPIFESTLRIAGQITVLDRQPLHDVGPGLQQAEQEFTISPHARGLVQSYIEYRGSGTIAIDQQEVQRLGD
jgi:hypothetical protein